MDLIIKIIMALVLGTIIMILSILLWMVLVAVALGLLSALPANQPLVVVLIGKVFGWGVPTIIIIWIWWPKKPKRFTGTEARSLWPSPFFDRKGRFWDYK